MLVDEDLGGHMSIPTTAEAAEIIARAAGGTGGRGVRCGAGADAWGAVCACVWPWWIS